MKQKLLMLVAFMALLATVTACGMNPVERLEQEASEQIAERILEESMGSENVNIETGEDGIVSFSADDGQGGQINIQAGADVDTSTFSALGFNIALPEGLSNGTTQQVSDGGQETMVTNSYEVTGLTAESFLQALHTSLTEAGFVYLDNMGTSATEPDFAGFAQMPFATYTHPDGYQFTIIWGETTVILGLVKSDSVPTEATGAEGSAPAQSLPTVLDGSMTVDGTEFTVGETFEVMLVINTPLSDSAWVGIVPTETPHGSEAEGDAVDVYYEYVSQAVDGRVTMIAPTVAGTYDVRLYSSDDSGVGLELASTTITVSE